MVVRAGEDSSLCEVCSLWRKIGAINNKKRRFTAVQSLLNGY
ncbi:hypothetical protein COK_1260 [Mannheimia haemolytica serotype A2 str. BOVINE]|nr:hypothetical protein COK_1260 [Mannheimia haemolytica serotype A2 str. BOVINE]